MDYKRLEKQLFFGAIIFIFVLLLIFIIVVFFKKRLVDKKLPSGRDPETVVQIQDKDKLVNLNKNGLIEFQNQNKVFYKQLDASQAAAIFQNIDQEIIANTTNPALLTDEDSYSLSYTSSGVKQEIKISRTNEWINSLFGDFGSDGGSQNWFSGFFSSPSPSITTANIGATGTTGTTTGGGGTSGSGSSGGSASTGAKDCPFWILNMCLYPRLGPPIGTPVPSASSLSIQPSSSPKPTKIAVPDCQLWDQQINRRTVISNTLCLTKEE